MDAERQFGAGHVDGAGNGHGLEFRQRPAIDDDHILTPVFHRLQFGGRNMRGFVFGLDEFTERLRRHVDAGKDLVSGPGPGRQPAV